MTRVRVAAVAAVCASAALFHMYRRSAARKNAQSAADVVGTADAPKIRRELNGDELTPLDFLELKHEVKKAAIDPAYLDSLFPVIKELFVPQKVNYSNTNPYIKKEDGKHGEKVQWKVSSYMEVDDSMGGTMQKAVNPDAALLTHCGGMLEQCNVAFAKWYKARHGEDSITELTRLQSFITRYRANPEERGLLRHIDGAQVDGSIVVGLPTDCPFEGGGLTVFEGTPEVAYKYAVRPGDMCLLDNFVWHQGNPITSGERWSLVIFYAVKPADGNRFKAILKNYASETKKKTRQLVHSDVAPADVAGKPLAERTKEAFRAVIRDDCATLGTLLDSGVDQNAKNGGGHTLLELAYERKKFACEAFLKKRGAFMDPKSVTCRKEKHLVEEEERTGKAAPL